MIKLWSGAVLLAGFALVVPAAAATGQCSLTGYDEFACDVNADGGGISFALPDGDTFVFSHIADGEGLAYLIAAETEPGRRPKELGAFVPAEGEPGCWFGAEDDITFCVAVAQ